ncbi:MAG: tRNA (adenosine(37)-N6)-threonylcarbamoyltransferase complex ATPase subunit type 1 TsaE [Verrucomicrobiota bacterium]
MRELVSKSPEETRKIGFELADELREGGVLCLSGDLGAGKTCLVRGIVSGLGGDPSEVNSPSFNLVNEYQAGSLKVFHWDLYRLTEKTDWSMLDLEVHLTAKSSLTIIEWPERYPDPWPGSAIQLHMSIPESSSGGAEVRKIRIRPA